MKLYGLAFEHRPFYVFSDAELIAPYNPLRQVPTRVRADGTVLTESFVCIDVIDERIALEQPSRRLLLPRSGPMRREGLRLGALCTGTCEKAVSLVYEREVREQPSALWSARCHRQIRETLLSLEASCAARRGAFVLDEHISHADIALSCTLTFIDEAHPGYLDDLALPALRDLASRCEAMPEFASVKQPFFVPQEPPRTQ
jgi:glutathione S-transferase